MKRPLSKWGAVVGTVCPHTPNAEQFYKSLDDLNVRLQPLYRKAALSSYDILEDVDKYVSRGVEEAADFLATSERLIATPDPRTQTLIKLIAASNQVHGSSSVVERALTQLETASADGMFAGQFLEQKALVEDGSNWVNFTHRMFDRLSDGSTSFVTFMWQQRDYWPNGLRADYDTFCRTQVNNLRQRMRKVLDQAFDPQLIPPSLYEVESAFDRLMRKVVGEPQQKARQTEADQRQMKLRQGRGSVLPRRDDKDSIEKRNQAIEPAALLFMGDRYEYGEQADLQKMVDTIVAGRNNDARFRADLVTMLEALTKEPFRPGSTPLSDVRDIKIGDSEKKHRVLRFNPNHATGLSFGNLGKESRLIYTVANRKIGVIAILPNHREYEQFIRTLRHR
jgi:hypothetical protein